MVISDLLMPHLGGHEVIRTVRAADPCLPIVAASGTEQDAATLQSFVDLRVGFVKKPFTKPELLGAVHAALRAARG